MTMDTRTGRVLTRTGGWAAVTAGVLGAATVAVLLLLPPMVDEDQFSFPLTAPLHVVFQSMFFLHHLLMAFALFRFWRAGLAGSGRFATIAGVGSTVVMTALAVWEVVVAGAAESAYPSPETDLIEGVYGVVSLATGVFLTLLGIAAIRARVLPSIDRWVALLVGVWVFVPLTPAIFAGFVAGRVAIGIWLLLFGWMGIGMLRWSSAHREPAQLADATR